MSEGVGYGGGYESFDIPIGDDFTGNVNEEGGNDSVPSTQQTPYKHPSGLHQNQHDPLMDNGQYHQHHVPNMGGPGHQLSQAHANQPRNYGYQHQNYQSGIPAQVQHLQLQMNQIQTVQSYQGNHGYRTLQSSHNPMASQIGKFNPSVHNPRRHYPFHENHRYQPYPPVGFTGQAGTHPHNNHPMGPMTSTPIQFFHSQERQNGMPYAIQPGKPLSHWPDVQNPAVNYYPETPDSQKGYEHIDAHNNPSLRQIGRTAFNYGINDNMKHPDSTCSLVQEPAYCNLGNNVINPAIPAGNYNQGPLAPVNATYHADAQDDPILGNDEMEVEEPVAMPRRKKQKTEKNKEPTKLQLKNREYQNRSYAKKKRELNENVAKLKEHELVYPRNETSINHKKTLILRTLGRDPLNERVNCIFAQTRNDGDYRRQLAAKQDAEGDFDRASLEYSANPINKSAKAKTKKKFEMETVQTRVKVMEEEFVSLFCF